MESKWQTIKLGEVMKFRKEFVTVDDLTTYKRCTARLHAKGIFPRDEVEGSRLKTKEQQVCKSGDFLVAEIDAKVGGFGIVPPELEGAIVSSHYFLFEINEDRLRREYLDYFIRTHAFQKQINARGSTNYAAIRPKHVLDIEIPLPPIDQQKRTIAMIESFMERIEEARNLWSEASREMVEVFDSELGKQFASLIYKYPIEHIRDLGFIARGKGPTYLEGSGYKVVNQKCIRWGLIDLNHAKDVVPDWFGGLASICLINEGDVLVNSTGEGTIGRAAVASSAVVGLPFDSHVLAIKPNVAKVVPKYIMYFMRSPLGQLRIHNAKGAKTTKQTELGVTKLGAITIPLPPLPVQRHITAYLNALQLKVDELEKLQAEVEKETGELIPIILDKAFNGDLHIQNR